jgi:hypothetical protein
VHDVGRRGEAMKRIGTLVVLMLGAVVASALPAQAKGITEATFTGPGLPPGGITVKTDDGNGPVNALSQQLMEGFGGVFEDDKLDASPVPNSKLGPPYQLTLSFDFAPRPLRAMLYPYAAGGPVLFIPAGQKLGPEFEIPTLPGGWTATDTTFLDTLVELGFPEKAPVFEAAPVQNSHPPAPQPAPSTSGGAAWLIVGGVLAVLLTGMIMVRSRRHPAAA